ncbi:MAG: Clp protease N-terminal domain-containing protein, partial [Planctomycetota bacterium]
MQPNYTQKSQSALARAQSLAQSAGHPELRPLHLLAGLLEEPEGVTAALLSKLGLDPAALAPDVEAALERLPRQEGGALAPS